MYFQVKIDKEIVSKIINIFWYNSKLIPEYILLNANKGWCHKYKLKEISPKKTKGLYEKSLKLKVDLVEKTINKMVPNTGIIVKILGYCKLSEKVIIEIIIKKIPNIEKILLVFLSSILFFDK